MAAGGHLCRSGCNHAGSASVEPEEHAAARPRATAKHRTGGSAFVELPDIRPQHSAPGPVAAAQDSNVGSHPTRLAAGGVSPGDMPCSSPVCGARTTITGDRSMAPSMVTASSYTCVRAGGRFITGGGRPQCLGPGQSWCSYSSSGARSTPPRTGRSTRARGPRCGPRGHGRGADAEGLTAVAAVDEPEDLDCAFTHGR